MLGRSGNMINCEMSASDAKPGQLSKITYSSIGARSRYQNISRPSRMLEIPASQRKTSEVLVSADYRRGGRLSFRLLVMIFALPPHILLQSIVRSERETSSTRSSTRPRGMWILF